MTEQQMIDAGAHWVMVRDDQLTSVQPLTKAGLIAICAVLRAFYAAVPVVSGVESVLEALTNVARLPGYFCDATGITIPNKTVPILQVVGRKGSVP